MLPDLGPQACGDRRESLYSRFIRESPSASNRNSSYSTWSHSTSARSPTLRSSSTAREAAVGTTSCPRSFDHRSKPTCVSVTLSLTCVRHWPRRGDLPRTRLTATTRWRWPRPLTRSRFGARRPWGNYSSAECMFLPASATPTREFRATTGVIPASNTSLRMSVFPSCVECDRRSVHVPSDCQQSVPDGRLCTAGNGTAERIRQLVGGAFRQRLP